MGPFFAFSESERVAIITGIGAAVVASIPAVGYLVKRLITRLDANNTQQHAANQAALNRIENKVDQVAERQLEHLAWHVDHPIPRLHAVKEPPAS